MCGCAGVAVHPRHLSWWERNVLKIHRHASEHHVDSLPPLKLGLRHLMSDACQCDMTPLDSLSSDVSAPDWQTLSCPLDQDSMGLQ